MCLSRTWWLSLWRSSWRFTLKRWRCTHSVIRVYAHSRSRMICRSVLFSALSWFVGQILITHCQLLHGLGGLQTLPCHFRFSKPIPRSCNSAWDLEIHKCVVRIWYTLGQDPFSFTCQYLEVPFSGFLQNIGENMWSLVYCPKSNHSCINSALVFVGLSV